MENKKKRPAEMETPTGTIEITLPDYNMFSPEEQEKAVKAMELIWMALQANGLNDRNCNRDPNNTLPTTFIKFSGHISNIEFSCHTHGYRSGYDADNHEEYQEKGIVLDTERECFFKSAKDLYGWLHGILEGMKHDCV